jgi:hypothetical protein
VRDFLRYEIRYEFISDLISVFLVCSGAGHKDRRPQKGVSFRIHGLYETC